MKFSQIAIYVPDQESYCDNFEQFFGNKMYTDRLKMFGIFAGRAVSDVDLELSFDHSIMDGVEVEYITSFDDCHWHSGKDLTKPFLSHLGIYCSKEDFQKYYEFLLTMGAELLQHSTSYDHSNKRKGDKKKSSRKYSDAIFNTEEYIGFNIKLSTEA